MRKLFLLFTLVFMITMSALAQDAPDFGNFGDEPPAPVNSALSILMTAGAAYGLKKLYKKK